MHRSACLILMFSLISVAGLGQTDPTDFQTLQAILSEIRQLRHDLQTTNAMAARAQIALYRLQRENEAVDHAMQRLNDARSKSERLETEKNNKALDIQQARNATSHSDNPNAQQHFEEVDLPILKSQLELLQRQEQQAKAQKAEAEQQLRDEQTKLAGLDDLLDRYSNALEEVGRK
jgi:DNA repair exonuclease SbcCD ATPase subunit